MFVEYVPHYLSISYTYGLNFHFVVFIMKRWLSVSDVSVPVKETPVSRVLARLYLKLFWIICLICLLLPQEVIF